MRKAASGGFTLIELMVALAVMAIVLGLAVPGFQSMVNGNRLTGAANELVASLQTARIEAIRRSRRVVVCTSANANAGVAATCSNVNINGWITFVDVNPNGEFDANDKIKDSDGTERLALLRNSTFDGNVLVGGADTVMFRADGMARDGDGELMTSGNVRMRIATSQPTKNVRCIDITTGGVAVRVPPAHDANCS
jgi:type IV fimbrial biogenesis protein FimT